MPKGIGYGPKAAKTMGVSMKDMAKMKKDRMNKPKKGALKNGKVC